MDKIRLVGTSYSRWWQCTPAMTRGLNIALAVYIAAVQPLGPEPIITTSLGASCSLPSSIVSAEICVLAGGIMVLVAVTRPTTASVDEGRIEKTI